MLSTSQDALQAFECIRVFQRGEQRAVHKPMLILLAVARRDHLAAEQGLLPEGGVFEVA
jgi:predicted restriction endonuclease